MRPARREELFVALNGHPDIQVAVAIVDNNIIDEINIYQATIRAMLDAVNALTDNSAQGKQEMLAPDYLLVDGLKLPHPSIPAEKIIKGDTLSVSIAAASIVAKVTRDNIMREYHHKWPYFGFDKHKGYPTKAHKAALHKHGPCPIHRRTFKF